ncbi:hypothetical protein O0L34_g2279 [Tuta absoluta]|nr:hypothetical protein O0L34_g2279 [Tuta absoluta]
MYDSDDTSSDDSDVEGYENYCSGGACPMRSRGCSAGSSGSGGSSSSGNGSVALPFDPAAIQNVILGLADQFDIRVLFNDKRMNTAMLITSGLALAGSVIGKHYGGNVGAVVGGAVGGACGVGIAAVSLRDVWDDVKNRLWELYEIAYDYMAGMGLRDYQQAASLLINKSGGGQGAQLAQILAQVASTLLKKKVTASALD